MKRLARQAAKTVGSCKRCMGMMGCFTLLSHQTSPANERSERGSVAKVRGCVHGTELPREVKPRSKRTSNETVKKLSRKANREMQDLSDCLHATFTSIQMTEINSNEGGTWTKNASR